MGTSLYFVGDGGESLSTDAVMNAIGVNGAEGRWAMRHALDGWIRRWRKKEEGY